MMTLNFQNVTHIIDNKMILKNQTLKINFDGVVCITGFNGCGKTTLLKMIHEIICPQSGSIIWNSYQQPKIGMVFQKPLMLKRSVLANIQFILNLTRNKENPYKYLELVSLSKLAKQYAPSLSGGEKQRLEIARLCAFNPDVWLLDEPTANLDLQFTAYVESLLLEKAQQGKKIICVSHNRKQVQDIANQVYHLENGQLQKMR